MRTPPIILILLLAVACSHETELPSVDYPLQPAITGLATPVQLQSGVTWFFEQDYFDQPLDSVRWPEHLSVEYTNSTESIGIQYSDQTPMEFTVRFYSGGYSYDIVFHRSRRIPVEVSVDAGMFDGTVTIFGTFNAWNRIADTMQREGDRWVYRNAFQPGLHEYKFFNNGEEYANPDAEYVSNGMGGFNSVLEVKPAGEPPVELVPLGADEKSVVVKSLPEGQDLIAIWENVRLPEEYILIDADSTTIFIPEAAMSVDRSTLRLFSSNSVGWSREHRIPLMKGSAITDASKIERSDWASARMYFMMVDRFHNGDTTNDHPLNHPEVLPIADYMGGDVAGIIQKLREGYFDQLGVNTIWLSPITQNPTTPWGLWDKGGVRTRFSAYHGYWPISNIRPDFRFANEEEIHTLLDEAHAKGYNVILDYVANHVHQDHPVYQQHPEWATDLYLPDGSLNTERWDDHRLTTWFDTFMPTLDLRRQEVVEPMTDSALVWVTEYDFDGFRHDATKHIDLRFWRSLTRKVKDRVVIPLGRSVYQIGETYGSPELIASYLSTGMLDAQFDFNAYDAVLSVLADSSVPVSRITDVMNSSWDWYGQHNTMGYISGNQDRSRFISIASGDVRLDEDQKLAGYTRDIGKPVSAAYRKLALLHIFNHSIPGIPVIYYGDEYGSPGANDPDNRRTMKFDSLDSDEEWLKNTVEVIGKLRSDEMALIYGTAEIESEGDDLIHIRRHYLNEVIDIFINRGNRTLSLPASGNTEIIYGDSTDEIQPLSAAMFKTTL